jgi:hypothetical protein
VRDVSANVRQLRNDVYAGGFKLSIPIFKGVFEIFLSILLNIKYTKFAKKLIFTKVAIVKVNNHNNNHEQVITQMP